MRFVVGADDEGDALDAAVERLRRAGHEVEMLERDQWPDVAERVARVVAGGDADQGLLFCWTGTGTAMAANRVPGARRWNDANVLVMSLKRTEPETARAIVDAWLSVEEPDEDERENIAKLD